MKNLWLHRSIVILAAWGLGACAHGPQPAAPLGCRADTDCKLERICDAGRCIWPPLRPAPTKPAVEIPPPPPPLRQPVAGPGLTMYRGGPRHQGRFAGSAPLSTPSTIWTYETRGSIVSQPALLPSGDLAFGGHDRRVHFVGPSGESRWIFLTGDLIFGSAAVTNTGLLLIGSDDDFLYALDPARKIQSWKFRIGRCRANIGVGPEASRCDGEAGPTIAADGTIYIGGDALYAIKPNGTLKWRFPTAAHVGSAPAIAPDGSIIFGCQDNLIHAVNPDGTKRWDFRTGDDVDAAPAIADDGTIYVGSDDQKLYALTPEGGLRWAFLAGDDIRASAAVARDGTVYVGSFDGLFYALRPDGTLSWTFRAADRILSSASIDGEGAILFGSQDDRLYALEPDGRQRWSAELGGDVDSAPVIGPDGTVYVGADDGRLYALR